MLFVEQSMLAGSRIGQVVESGQLFSRFGEVKFRVCKLFSGSGNLYVFAGEFGDHRPVAIRGRN